MTLSKFKPFRKPTDKEIAVKELEDAKRALLAEQARFEYHLKMSEYYKTTITRLTKYIKEDE